MFVVVAFAVEVVRGGVVVDVVVEEAVVGSGVVVIA